MTNTYHATPYDISAAGFYFKDYDDYNTQAATHKNEYGDPVEEYEIQFIDGDNYKLFSALSVNQANLKQWFDDYENLDGEEYIKAIYLAEDQRLGRQVAIRTKRPSLVRWTSTWIHATFRSSAL